MPRHKLRTEISSQPCTSNVACRRQIDTLSLNRATERESRSRPGHRCTPTLLLVEDQRIVVRFAVGVRALVVDRERLAICRHDAVHTADHFSALLERDVAGGGG